MTKAHVEKFSEVLLSDPDMSEKLGLSKFLDTLEKNDSEAQASSKATFVDNAVEEATSRGLIFSKDEFIENVDVEVLAMQSGELSDLQLEAVAGGKRTCSDIRLKKNIKKIGTEKGINVYEWEWNAEGLRIGADQYPTKGVIAQEIQKTHPAAVSRHASGYLMVNYKEISHGFH